MISSARGQAGSLLAADDLDRLVHEVVDDDTVVRVDKVDHAAVFVEPYLADELGLGGIGPSAVLGDGLDRVTDEARRLVRRRVVVAAAGGGDEK